MTLDRNYIFIIEEEGIGFVMGSYDDEKEAIAKANKLWDEMYQDHETPYLERNPPLLKYKIHPTGYFFYPDALACRTNGLRTTLIYKNDFSIKEFMFLREHTVYAISLDECMEENAIAEIIDHAAFLAN